MAEAKEDIGDMDILTCSICLEVFKTPRYLPCLHTFCEACLVTYVESSIVDRDNTKVIPCPICRKNFELEKETTESLKSQFPHNHLINSLLERKAIRKSEKLCHVCELSDTPALAVSWCVVCQEALCKNCENCHRKFKMTSSHNIIFIQDMIKEQHLDYIYSGIYCEKHLGEVFKIFCEDHSKPCCTICATVEHRKCNSVIEIHEAAKKFKDSNSVKTLKDDMVNFKYNLIEARVSGEKNIEFINERYKELTNEIESAKSSVITHVTLLAKTAVEDAETNRKAAIKKEEAFIEDVKRHESTVVNWLRILDSSSQGGTDIEFLIEGHRLIDRKKALETDLKIYNPCDETDIKLPKFTPDHTVATFKTIVSSIGDVRQVDMKTGNINILFRIDVGQTNKWAVSGLFIKQWIILINNFKKLILLYDAKGKYLRELICHFRPYDVAEISGDEICVSGFSRKDLCMISVPDMKITRTISAPVACYGLDYFNTTFLLCLETGITIAKLQGDNIEEEKTINTSGHNLYAKAVKQDKYICANGVETVISTNGDKHLFTYTSEELHSPRGMDVDFQGNIYICGYSSENIHQISSTGKRIRIIKASDLETKSPWVIKFKKNSNMFLLTSLESGKVVVCKIA